MDDYLKAVINAEYDFTFEQTYLSNKFISVNMVRDSVFKASRLKYNAESLKHVLRQLITWKSKTVPTLVNLISKQLDSQFKVRERAVNWPQTANTFG